jgi:exodeoxyribonuclease VII large subunit
VRSELTATLEDLAHRKRRCVMRPVTLGRERLAARVSRLPRPTVLVAQAQQRLDDAGERLRRGLGERARQSASRLALAGVKLVPALLQREVAIKSERLAALDRLRRQLDPKAPLARGYALVHAPGHPVVASREVAAKQPALTLEFADGSLEVSPKAAPRPAPRRTGTAARQDDLFE